MNSVLRKVARGLKYRPLPGLIGKRVTIQSANSVPANIGAMLDRSFPLPVRFSGPQEPWLTGALAKYRILDLTFALDALEWKPGDTAGISLLKEFGFIIQRNEVSEDVWESMSQDDDPTCIMSLDEDIGRSQALLRLFVEEVPRRGLFDYLKET